MHRLPGTQTEEEEEEGVDHSRYLASHLEQDGHQIREAEREMEVAVRRSIQMGQ